MALGFGAARGEAAYADTAMFVWTLLTACASSPEI
jgi:hypothetical protein